MTDRIAGGSLLIIDGHGATSEDTFDFRRTDATKCNIYSYVFQNIEIRGRQSNAKIDQALQGVIPDNYSDSNASRIGGTLLRDRILGAQNPGGAGREWADPVPAAGFNTTNVNLNAIGGGNAPMIIRHDGATPATSGIVFIEITPGSAKRVLLSTIISYFNTRPYDILWMVCRTEI